MLTKIYKCIFKHMQRHIDLHIVECLSKLLANLCGQLWGNNSIYLKLETHVLCLIKTKLSNLLNWTFHFDWQWNCLTNLMNCSTLQKSTVIPETATFEKLCIWKESLCAIWIENTSIKSNEVKYIPILQGTMSFSD